METKQVWINLPVIDLKRSKLFYKEIGFKENPMHKKSQHPGSFLIGEHDFVMMLFPEQTFAGFIGKTSLDGG